MMDVDELVKLAERLRNDKDVVISEEIVAAIEADVNEYQQRFLTEPLPQTPPSELNDLLPLMGWVIYEASWDAIQKIVAGYETARDEERRRRSVQAGAWIVRLADCARALPWPEYSPRALGAIRAHALAESKKDTEDGFASAHHIHVSARERHKNFRSTLAGLPDTHPAKIGLDEILLQIALAETGTACRTAERIISRWQEDVTDHSQANEERWVQRMYRDLREAIELGEEALATADRIKSTYGLVHKIDAERMALVTWVRNPGIMTARAALLALALTPAMEVLRPKAVAGSWAQERVLLMDRFTHAYHEIEEPVPGEDGAPVPLRFEHQRALVQLRLNLALLMPGHSLVAREQFHPCLQLDPLDDKAVTEMCHWLRTELEAPGGRNDTNVIGSATMPGFIQSVVALRSLHGDGPGYLRWRLDAFDLDRHATEPDRRARVEAALEEAQRRPSLRISGQ